MLIVPKGQKKNMKILENRFWVQHITFANVQALQTNMDSILFLVMGKLDTWNLDTWEATCVDRLPLLLSNGSDILTTRSVIGICNLSIRLQKFPEILKFSNTTCKNRGKSIRKKPKKKNKKNALIKW